MNAPRISYGFILLGATIFALALVVATGAAPAAAETPEVSVGSPVAVDRPAFDLETFGFSPRGGLGLDYTGCGGVTAPVVNAAYEQSVIELTNEERLDNGALPPLKRRETLVDAARYHGTDMRDDDYFNHNTYDRNASGGLVYVCSWVTRVTSFYGSYTALAENIAAGYTTPESVVSAWMASPGHRSNILSSSVWEIGAGYSCCGGTYTRYWGQNFGKKSGVYPLVIDREAATTDSTSVDLYVYGNFSEMRLRNDNDSWGSWQTFDNDFTWTLNNEAGLRTVSIEMRSGSPTYSASDTIELLVTSSPTPSSTAPPTSTPILPTNTPVPPTSTPTSTNTPVPPTSTPTSTNTPVPPTSTPTSTNTPVPPTSTPVPPTSTPTSTNTPVPPTSTPTATNTPVPPTSTPTSTNTPVPPTNTSLPPTNTPIPPTSTSTSVPPTATATATTLTFVAVHDAYVDSANPNGRYGLLDDLAVQDLASSEQNTYVKFDVTGLSGAPSSAVVRLFVSDGSNSGGSIHSVSNTFQGRIQAWVESGISWVNAPSITGSPLSTLGAVSAGTWAEYTVTSAVSGDGTYSFGITSDSADRAVFNSRQATSNPPELRIQP